MQKSPSRRPNTIEPNASLIKVLVEKRIKAIKFADRSEFGWNTVNAYLSDKLASNSEAEKRIFCSERRALK